MIDYNDLINKIVGKKTFQNVDGCNAAINIIECLEICPFIDVVAAYVGVLTQAIYDSMRYYLPKEDFHRLLEDLKERRLQSIDLFKLKEQKKLEEQRS